MGLQEAALIATQVPTDKKELQRRLRKAMDPDEYVASRKPLADEVYASLLAARREVEERQLLEEAQNKLPPKEFHPGDLCTVWRPPKDQQLGGKLAYPTVGRAAFVFYCAIGCFSISATAAPAYPLPFPISQFPFPNYNPTSQFVHVRSMSPPSQIQVSWTAPLHYVRSACGGAQPRWVSAAVQRAAGGRFPSESFLGGILQGISVSKRDLVIRAPLW